MRVYMSTHLTCQSRRQSLLAHYRRQKHLWLTVRKLPLRDNLIFQAHTYRALYAVANTERTTETRSAARQRTSLVRERLAHVYESLDGVDKRVRVDSVVRHRGDEQASIDGASGHADDHVHDSLCKHTRVVPAHHCPIVGRELALALRLAPH